MTNYGVRPEGFVRKPLAVTLAEIEALLMTEFGPEVIQTAQSPLGQLNGLFSELITQLWEMCEDVYQTYDPSQAEGTRLDVLSKIRLIGRGANETDAQFRQAIMNENTARITFADFIRALQSLAGVTFAQVFANETGQNNEYGMPANTVTAAVIGGDEDEIADVINRYVTPGITTYGNQTINTAVDGFCRAVKFVRPVEIETSLTVYVRLNSSRRGCPAPAPSALATALLEYMSSNTTRPWNGQPIDAFFVRSFLEANFSGVELLKLTAVKQGQEEIIKDWVGYNFFEIADVKEINIEVA